MTAFLSGISYGYLLMKLIELGSICNIVFKVRLVGLKGFVTGYGCAVVVPAGEFISVLFTFYNISSGAFDEVLIVVKVYAFAGSTDAAAFFSFTVYDIVNRDRFRLDELFCSFLRLFFLFFSLFVVSLRCCLCRLLNNRLLSNSLRYGFDRLCRLCYDGLCRNFCLRCCSGNFFLDRLFNYRFNNRFLYSLLSGSRIYLLLRHRLRCLLDVLRIGRFRIGIDLCRSLLGIGIFAAVFCFDTLDRCPRFLSADDRRRRRNSAEEHRSRHKPCDCFYPKISTHDYCPFLKTSFCPKTTYLTS